MKAAYNMNRIEICMYCTINMHEGWCSPTIPLLSHKTWSLPTTEWSCQSDVLCHVLYQHSTTAIQCTKSQEYIILVQLMCLNKLF